MNQQIIFNDDLTFIPDKKHWQWSAMLSGEAITIIVESTITQETFTTSHQLDWELAVEDWLLENEIGHNVLTLSLD